IKVTPLSFESWPLAPNAHDLPSGATIVDATVSLSVPAWSGVITGPANASGVIPAGCLLLHGQRKERASDFSCLSCQSFPTNAAQQPSPRISSRGSSAGTSRSRRWAGWIRKPQGISPASHGATGHEPIALGVSRLAL